MKKVIWILFVSVIAVGLRADLNFRLPKGASYKVPKEQIAEAIEILKMNFTPDTNRLQTILRAPIMCGPGLWDQIKSSPRFLKPPTAKTEVEIPLPGGRRQNVPAALLQNSQEASSLVSALSEILIASGNLTVREPNEAEFKAYWATIPFEKITDPLLVVAATNHSFICQINTKKTVFWIDDVRNMKLQR